MRSTFFHRLASLGRWLPAAALAFAALTASAQQDPPSRVGAVTQRQGAVVFAPAGYDQWGELLPNRPLTQADRLWTDQDGRVELHFGNVTVHLDGRTSFGIVALDDRAIHLSLAQGTINAHVRDLHPGERMEVGTPNLAVRAMQPAGWRLDVDPQAGVTRVQVHSGQVQVYGENGRAETLLAGQQAAFAGRSLQSVGAGPSRRDAFDAWAADRNWREDQAQSARYVPREVVGYQQLDPYGTWSHEPSYGAVWYPAEVTPDWAPYRQGHWSWIAPWGWTWIDDAPWGFAPFHYGRWAYIGSRWAWVPGRFVARPVYAPALVVFAGGAGSSLVVNAGPGIAWYPLAPGEAWYPGYATSAVYVRNANPYVTFHPRGSTITYYNSRYANAVTAVRVEDFSLGRPVWNHWHRVDPQVVQQAPARPAPAVQPDWGRFERPVPAAVQAVPGAPRPAVTTNPGHGLAPGGLQRAPAPLPGPAAQPQPLALPAPVQQPVAPPAEPKPRRWEREQRAPPLAPLPQQAPAAALPTPAAPAAAPAARQESRSPEQRAAAPKPGPAAPAPAPGAPPGMGGAPAAAPRAPQAQGEHGKARPPRPESAEERRLRERN